MMTSWKKAMIIMGSLSLLCTACADTEAEVAADSETIPLLEPVGAVGNYEAAALHNIYNAEVYNAIVYPQVTEYEYTDNQEFQSYAACPGDSVAKGEALMQGNQEDLEEQLEDLRKKVLEMEEEYTEYCTEANEELAKLRETESLKQSIVDNLEESKPEQYVQGSVSGGNAVETQSYTKWLADYDKYQGQLSQASLATLQKETALKQKSALYELDHQYQCRQLEKIQEKIEQTILYTDHAGEVVAMPILNPGDRIAAGGAVAAVGDTTKPVLRCKYVAPSAISSASAVYAFVNGEKYEIIYEPMNNSQYLKLVNQGKEVYSSFYFAETPPEISVGDFAVIVVMGNEKKQVLAVPSKSIHREAGVNYVYIQENEETVRRDVKKGITDGMYTEILSGIEEGELVMTSDAVSFGDGETTVEYGDFFGNFMGSGYLYYPDSEIVVTPVEYGTAYFEEYQVSLYQHVNKGDVLATIEVDGDDLTLLEKEKKLQRARERLSDMQKLDADTWKKQIAEKQEEIAQLEEETEKIKKDASTTQIVADRTGIVMKLADVKRQDILDFEEELVQIADESNCYVQLENAGEQLNYGNTVVISYFNKQSKMCTSEGRVVTIASPGVQSERLKSENVLVKVSESAVEEMIANVQGTEDQRNHTKYNVTTQINTMKHVLLVPREAVRVINGRTCVCVIQEDGSRVVTNFVAGGFDKDQYWAVEGLTEGMKVCCE